MHSAHSAILTDDYPNCVAYCSNSMIQEGREHTTPSANDLARGTQREIRLGQIQSGPRSGIGWEMAGRMAQKRSVMPGT